MRTFNYAWLRDRKWDTDLLGLIAAIYKEAGKQELFFKQQPAKMEVLWCLPEIKSTLSGRHQRPIHAFSPLKEKQTCWKKKY